MDLSKIRDTLFLTKDERTPCPKCKNKSMQFNPNGSSGYDFACIFTCSNCGEKVQSESCLFRCETIRAKRMPLIKYKIFQFLNWKNPQYKL